MWRTWFARQRPFLCNDTLWCCCEFCAQLPRITTITDVNRNVFSWSLSPPPSSSIFIVASSVTFCYRLPRSCLRLHVRLLCTWTPTFHFKSLPPWPLFCFFPSPFYAFPAAKRPRNVIYEVCRCVVSSLSGVQDRSSAENGILCASQLKEGLC